MLIPNDKRPEVEISDTQAKIMSEKVGFPYGSHSLQHIVDQAKKHGNFSVKVSPQLKKVLDTYAPYN